MTAAWKTPALLAAVGLLFAEYAVHAEDGGLQMGLLTLLLLPALLLAAADSPWLVSYVLAVWAIGPEARRLADWAAGHYHPLAPLSLAPLLATATLLLPVARHAGPLPLRLRQSLAGFAAALFYGLVIGALHHGLAVFYDGANFALPLLFLVYAALRPADARERDRRVSRLATLAAVVAAYAWVQFLAAPAWDMFWMQASGMHSIGQPEARHIRVFATLNSPGPAGMFFAAALVPMLLRREWRGPLGWGGVLLTASALALTLVRAAWLMALAGVVVYSLRSAEPRRARRFAALAVAAASLTLFVPHLPGGEIVTARVATLGNLSQDLSFQERANFSIGFLPCLLAEPFGSGLGTVGVAEKASGEAGSPLINFDNGYWAMLLTFGLAGACLFGGALWRLAQAAHEAAAMRPALSALALAALASALTGLFFVNVLNGLTGTMFYFLVSCSFGKCYGRHPIYPSLEDRSLPCHAAGTGAQTGRRRDVGASPGERADRGRV